MFITGSTSQICFLSFEYEFKIALNLGKSNRVGWNEMMKEVDEIEFNRLKLIYDWCVYLSNLCKTILLIM